jgi:hypothetical protein
MSYKKHLFAIHTDAHDRVLKTKIAEGTTADFTKTIGFQIENIVERGENEGGFEPMEGLSGTYPAINAESFSKLEGKLLTLCDATFTNKEQRESFKSIVKDNLWTMYSQEIESVQAHYKIADTHEGVLVQE